MDGSTRALMQQLVIDRFHVKVRRDRVYSPSLEVLFCLQTWWSNVRAEAGVEETHRLCVGCSRIFGSHLIAG
jgi:hypothetical protein